MKRVISESLELASSHLVRAGLDLTRWLAGLDAPEFTAHEIDEAGGMPGGLRPLLDPDAAVPLDPLLLRHPPTACPGLVFD